MLKYKYLPKRKTSITLTYITTLLVDEVLPDMYQKYLFENYQMSSNYRTYRSIVPDFLKVRPRKVILHCLERRQKSRKFSTSDIQITDNQKGIFVVKGTKQYQVDFGIESGQPSCACKDWIRFKVPCKHFFAIFNHCPSWSWNSLPQSYLKSEYLSQDTKALDILCSPQTSSLPTPTHEDLAETPEDVDTYDVQPDRKNEVHCICIVQGDLLIMNITHTCIQCSILALLFPTRKTP